MICLFSYYFFEFNNKITMVMLLILSFFYINIYTCLYVCIYMWKQNIFLVSTVIFIYAIFIGSLTINLI